MDAIVKVWRYMNDSPEDELTDVPPAAIAYFAPMTRIQILRPLMMLDKQKGASRPRLQVKYGITPKQAENVQEFIDRRG